MKKFLLIALTSFGATALFGQSITGISPDKGNQGQTLPIIISGQNTQFTSGSNTFLSLTNGVQTINQGTSTGFTNVAVVNSTTISANLSVPGSSALGFYDLWVSSGSSTITKQMAFEVRQPGTPAIVMLPAGSQPNKTFTAILNVNGSSFKTASQKIDKAWLSLGNEVIELSSNVQILNANTFSTSLTIPAGVTQGMWDINVYTDDKQLYASKQAFSISNTFSRAEYNNAAFDLYPNPATNKVIVKFEGHYNGMDVQIFDLSGKAVSNFTFKQNLEENKMEVITEALPTGVYTMQFLSKEGGVIAVKKLVRK